MLLSTILYILKPYLPTLQIIYPLLFPLFIPKYLLFKIIQFYYTLVINNIKL